MGKPALLVLDLINEITHEDGAYPEVCLDEIRAREVIARAAAAIAHARESRIPVIFVVVGFSADYSDWPASSPLFHEVKDRGALVIGSWGTQVADALSPRADELVVTKNMVSPFYGTGLDAALRADGIETLYLAGATTDLVVLSTCRDAHDRGYEVVVMEDATATSDPELHSAALTLIARTASVESVSHAFGNLTPAGVPDNTQE